MSLDRHAARSRLSDRLGGALVFIMTLGALEFPAGAACGVALWKHLPALVLGLDLPHDAFWLTPLALTIQLSLVIAVSGILKAIASRWSFLTITTVVGWTASLSEMIVGVLLLHKYGYALEFLVDGSRLGQAGALAALAIPCKWLLFDLPYCRSKAATGACPSCGYAPRTSSDRCSECGTITG